MKKYYLAYGSNLNLNQMRERCPTAKALGKSLIPGYRLAFKGNASGFLTIEEDDNSIVPVGIFEINEFDEFILDQYEGYPIFYSKEYMEVVLNNEIIKGLIYVMNPNFSYKFPSMNYLQACTEGYNDFGFNRQFLSNALELSMNSQSKTLIK